MKRTITILGVTALAVAIAAPLAFAHGGGGGDGDGHRGERGERGPRIERMAKKLDLTADQQDAMKALRQGDRSEMKALRQALREKRQAMRALFTADRLDIGAIKAAHAEAGQLKATLGSLRLEKKLEMLSILTPEQRVKAAERKGGKFGKRGKRGKRGRHGKRGGDWGPPADGGFAPDDAPQLDTEL